MTTLAGLCGFAFLAGMIDAMVGGGGLIQLPGMFLLLPSVGIPTLFGTNKLASIAGTAAAATQYARHVSLNWRTLLPAALAAFVFAFLGARAVSHLPPDALRPVILILLVAVALFTFFRKDFGSIHAPIGNEARQRGLGVGVGAVIGFYDGFFGPGTGSFLIFVFISLFGFSFLHASASAKVVNTATNFSALLYFAFTHHILYGIALPMAACNVLGSVVGTRVAVRYGTRFMRIVFLVVVTILILRLGFDAYRHLGSGNKIQTSRAARSSQAARASRRAAICSSTSAWDSGASFSRPVP